MHHCNFCAHAGVETDGDVTACNMCEYGSNFEADCDVCKHRNAVALDYRNATLEDTFACKYCHNGSMFAPDSKVSA